MTADPRPVRSWSISAGCAGLGVLAVTLLLAVRHAGFFFQGDKQAQYLATFHYIGSELRQGRFPILVPWEGTSANLILDPQYGLLNPVGLVQSLAVGAMGDVGTAAAVLAIFWLIVLAAGAAAWLVRLGAATAWAGVGGFAAAMGGYGLWWLGPSWHPGLVSLAFLPWLGWALSARRSTVIAGICVAAACYGVVAAGWPFTTLAAVLLVGANVGELLVSGDRRGAAQRAAWSLVGALLAVPTVAAAWGALEWTTRNESIRNTGFLVPQLPDALNTGVATAAADMPNFSGPVVVAPILLAGGLGLALLPLIAWPRGWWRTPGALTIAITATALLLGTQAPSDLGPFRWPFRFLGPWQVVVAVAVVSALALWGVRVTRTRVALSAVVVAASILVTVARTPQDLPAHGISALLAVAAVVAALAGSDRWRAPLLGAVLLATMVTAALVRGQNTSIPDWHQPTDVASYQEGLGSQPARSLVLYPQSTNFRSAADQGVFIGQNYLLSPNRSGVGYSSLGQRNLNRRMCLAAQGWVCPAAIDFLVSTEPQTGRRWVELLGFDTITVHRSFAAELSSGLDGGWVRTEATTDFIVLRRPADPRLVGRLSFLPPGASATADDIGATTQTYTIDSPTGGRVVTADVYWPGYTATWNDQPLPVQPLDNSLVAVTTPPGPGTLTITYRPAGTTTAIASVLAGLLLAGATGALGSRRRRSDRGLVASR